MKMRVSLKVLGVLWILLLLVISGLLYNAYSKFKPEIFVALLTEQVQKNYPDAKLSVGKVSYRFSMDFNLKLQDIHLRRSEKLLGSIGEIELKIPWWLLLVNKGNARINLSNLDIYVDQSQSQALLQDSKNAKTEEKLKVIVPSYFAETKFTLRAKSISVRDIHNARRYFTLSKLLVRDFQYGKNSAFELNIPVEINHKGARYLSDLWLFGDVTPEPKEWVLNFRGEFRSRENNDNFQIEDLVINGASKFSPTSLAVSSQIQLFNEKEPIGSGSLFANQENLSLNLDLKKLPLNYFGFIYEEIKNPFLNKLVADGSGHLNFKKVFKSSSAQLDGKINFSGHLELNEKKSVPGQWQISFFNNRWEVSFMGPKGEASYFRRSVLDVNKDEVSLYNEELGFTGMDLLLLGDALKPFETFLQEPSDSFYTSTVSFKDCLVGTKVFNGNFRYGQSPEQKFYQGSFVSEDSHFKLDFQKKDLTKNFLDLKLQNFKWIESLTFMKPFFTAQEALLSGSVQGRWDESWMSGEWLIDLKGKNFAKDEGLIPDLMNKTSAFFNMNATDFSTKSVNVVVKNNILSLDSLLLEGTDVVKIAGKLSSTKKSFLTLSYPKNKKLKPVKKEIIDSYWIEKE